MAQNLEAPSVNTQEVSHNPSYHGSRVFPTAPDHPFIIDFINRQASCHNGTSEPSATAQSQDAASISHTAQRGPIRVSEDGEVWRSPPQTAVRQLPLTMAATAESRPTSQPNSATSSVVAVHLINASGVLDHKKKEKPGFSPLPPFARTSGELIDRPRPTKWVRPSAFRKTPQSVREASRPPQIASTSAANYGGTGKPASGRPPPPQQGAHVNTSAQHVGSKGKRKTSHGHRDYGWFQKGAANCHDATRHAGLANQNVRRPPILASPAPPAKDPLQSPGHEIDSHTLRSGLQHSKPACDAQSLSADPPATLRERDVFVCSTSRNGRDRHIKLEEERITITNVAIPPSIALPSPSERRSANVTPSMQGSVVIQTSASSSNPTPKFSEPPTAVTAAPSSLVSLTQTQTGSHYTSQRTSRKITNTATRSVSAIKRESTSPPALQVTLPPSLSGSQPLFDPAMSSPEERKPIIHSGDLLTSRPDPTAASAKLATGREDREMPVTDALNRHRHQICTDVKPQAVPLFRPVKQSETGTTSPIIEAPPPRAMLPARNSELGVPADSSRPVKQAHRQSLGGKPSSGQAVGYSAVQKLPRAEDSDMSDMEVDELAPDPHSEPVTGTSRAAECSDSPSTKVSEEPQRRHSGKTTTAPASYSGKAIAGSAKGKQRRCDSAIASKPSSNGTRTPDPGKRVIDLASDEESETGAFDSSAGNAYSQAVARTEHVSSSGGLEPDPSMLPHRLGAIVSRPGPGEERTRLFSLPPKVLAALQAEGGRPKPVLRRFVNDRYEDLELELRSPLRRIDEILKGDTIRLVYIELELASNEIALPLPHACLKSTGGTSQERELQRNAFVAQQIVRLAKSGKEAETTRLTSAHLIVAIKASQEAAPNTSFTPVAEKSVKSAIAGAKTADVEKRGNVSVANPNTALTSTAVPPKTTLPSRQPPKRTGKKRKLPSNEYLVDNATPSVSAQQVSCATKKRNHNRQAS